MKALGKNNT